MSSWNSCDTSAILQAAACISKPAQDNHAVVGKKQAHVECASESQNQSAAGTLLKSCITSDAVNICSTQLKVSIC